MRKFAFSTAVLAFGFLTACGGGGGGGGTTGGGTTGVCSLSSAGSGLFFNIYDLNNSPGEGSVPLSSGDIVVLGTDGSGVSNSVFKLTLDGSGSLKGSKDMDQNNASRIGDGTYASQGGLGTGGVVNISDGLVFTGLSSVSSYTSWVVKVSSTDGTVAWKKRVNANVYSVMNSSTSPDTISAVFWKIGSEGFALFLGSDGTLSCETSLSRSNFDYKRPLYAQVDFSCAAYLFGLYDPSSSPTGRDIYVLDVSASPSILSVKTLGISGDENIAHVIRTPSDGGFAILAVTGNGNVPDDTNEILVVKLNSSLGIKWIKKIGESRADVGYYLMEDGTDIVVVGTTYSTGNNTGDIYMAKLDKDGNILWQKYYNLCSSDVYEQANHVTKDSSGNYIITGYYSGSTTGGKPRPFVLKVNSSGSVNGSCASENTANLTVTDVSASFTPRNTGDWSASSTNTLLTADAVVSENNINVSSTGVCTP